VQKIKLVIFLLNLFWICNQLNAQVPYNDNCDSSQLLCPNVYFLGSTNDATVDTCITCSDYLLFDPATANATIWYKFNSNNIGDSLNILIDIINIPFGVEVGGALQLRLVKKNNSCSAINFNPIGALFSSTSTDTTFVFSQLESNTEYAIVLNENTFGVTNPGIDFQIMISGKSVEIPQSNGNILYDDSICQNDINTYSLELTNCPNMGLVSWFINDQLITSNNSLVFETNEVEDGDTVKAITTCFSNCSEPIVFITNPVHVYSFYVSAGNDTIINPGETAQLHAETSVENYFWDTQLFISSQNVLEPFVYPDETFTFPFVAYDNGCVQYDYVTVFVRNGLEIPNTFSPNFDGTNDSWKIPDIELYPKNNLSIYNRYGTLLASYSPYTPATEWTGTWQGADLPEGVYFYILELNDSEKNIYKGTISIIR